MDMPPRSKSIAIGGLLVSLGIIALGIFFLVGVFNIRVLATYARVGPRFFPLVVSIGLLACGTLLAIQALRGIRIEPQEEENVDIHALVNLRAIWILLIAFVLNFFLMRPLGFILSSTLLFFGATVAFGNRQYLKNTLWGLGLSLLIFILFTRLLQLNLPEGVLSFLNLMLGII
jgi:putative tricarboxylic transport membrane protein